MVVTRIKTEVVGLELELSTDGGTTNGWLLFLKDGVTIWGTESGILGTRILQDLFQLKDQPGQNFFDHVLETLDKAAEKKNAAV